MKTCKMNWLMCPTCGNKTRIKVRKDTVLEHFPLFRPKCKQEILINVRQLKYISYHRARRIDAEPIIRRIKTRLSALFI